MLQLSSDYDVLLVLGSTYYYVGNIQLVRIDYISTVF